MVQTVMKSSFTFKSDIRKTYKDGHPSGVLHAFRSSSREEHCFAWVADISLVESALEHLERYGFERDRIVFIPFTSKTNWVHRYPHAFPYIDCNNEGKVTGFPYWHPNANTALDVPPEVQAESASGKAYHAASARKARKKSPKLFQSAILPNDERDELHVEIYKYFQWLHRELVDLETTDPGRRSVRTAGITVSGIQTVLAKMESAFKVIRQTKGELVEEDEEQNESAPLLEECLECELCRRVDEARPDPDEQPQPKINASFDAMFERLMLFKQEHGHVDVPLNYKKDRELGRWVSGLRVKKKNISKEEEDCDPDAGSGEDETDDQNVDTDTNNETAEKAKRGSRKYLTKERIEILDNVGFSWTVETKNKSWEERFQDLIEYREIHGTFRVPRSHGTLGEWVSAAMFCF